MNLFIKLLVCIIALEHLLILYIEVFKWTTKGSIFFPDSPADFFEKTKSMAANQGLYNGFLAAGLIWSLTISTSSFAYSVATFFISCVVVAGVFGSLTISKKILVTQALPAIIVLMALVIF